MGHKEHKHHAPKQVNCMVITVSDTRTEETDTSGKHIVALLQKNGHTVIRKTIVPDEPKEIRNLLEEWQTLSESEKIVLMLRNLIVGIERPEPSAL